MAERALVKPPAVLLTHYWLPVLIYLATVQILGSQPDLQVPMVFPDADKVVHVFEYLGLGVLLARAIRASVRVPVPIRTAFLAVGIGFGMGVTDEFLQSFVPGRMSSMNDLLADMTGLLLAQVIFLIVVRD